jgi:hypothetical protein
MNFYTDLFTPETWNKFREHGADVSGFPIRRKGTAQQVVPGDLFCCYVTRVSRWCGILEVVSSVYIDATPIWMDPDPYVVRFKVSPIVVLDLQFGIPIFDDAIWPNLEITRGLQRREFGWAHFANLRASPRRLAAADGDLLVKTLKEQSLQRRLYPLSQQDQKRLGAATKVKSATKTVLVEVPSDQEEEDLQRPTTEVDAEQAPRHSTMVQSALARIGIEMGFRVSVPRNDRQAVLAQIPVGSQDAFLEELPLNYDDVTLRTIEQIDVIWLRNRAIPRAFEVEHTTAIYSGLLRMADLFALQPNMDIRLHIVAPDDKQELACHG